jgi:hypothetical protein
MPRLAPADAAQNLFEVISRALAGAALEDYGLSLSREQGDQLLRELLSLCLFWAWSALDSKLSDKDRDLVWGPLMRRLRDGWSSELGLPPDESAGYDAELVQRRRHYESLTREGADPPAVAAEAAGVMEADSLIEPEDRPKLLALLVDLVPADELGEAVEELELMD